jgi:hypothetical protein
MQRPKAQTLPRLKHGGKHDNAGKNSSWIIETAGYEVDFPIVANDCRPLPTTADHCRPLPTKANHYHLLLKTYYVSSIRVETRLHQG